MPSVVAMLMETAALTGTMGDPRETGPFPLLPGLEGKLPWSGITFHPTVGHPCPPHPFAQSITAMGSVPP